MKSLLTLLPCAAATPALAHPGHIADLAGHDHWVAGAAIAIAIALGLRGALRGLRGRPARAGKRSRA